MLKELKKDMEKVKKIMYGNINKDTRNLKRNQKILELNSTVTEMKN